MVIQVFLLKKLIKIKKKKQNLFPQLMSFLELHTIQERYLENVFNNEYFIF